MREINEGGRMRAEKMSMYIKKKQKIWYFFAF